MLDFITFLLQKVYKPIAIPESYVHKAFEKTVADIHYHFPDINETEIRQRIIQNQNELTVFLFRLGEECHLHDEDELKPQLHWLLKEICGCEIYFNNKIDTGFYIVHGTGTVIGSRNVIGQGFKIHQGCTIGHRKNGEGMGNVIGKDVTMYCNSSILGQLKIGDGVVIGAHVLVSKDVGDGKVVLQK